MNSKSGGTPSRAGATIAACSSGDPQPTIANMQPGWKWYSSGMNGRGGAFTPMICAPASAGSPAMVARMSASASAPDSTPQKKSAAFTRGPTGWIANSNSVTTPKLPPPPRSAQCRSGFSFADAFTTRPSAVTTVAETRLSQLSPCLRDSQPIPPPSVKPATPVWLTTPPGTARPCSWVAASSCAHVVPPPQRARCAPGSTVTAVIGLRSIIRPSSSTP